MKTPDLANLLPRFFTEHLVEQRNVSPRTVAAYRDTFRLLLRFLQRSRRTKPAGNYSGLLCGESASQNS